MTGCFTAASPSQSVLSFHISSLVKKHQNKNTLTRNMVLLYADEVVVSCHPGDDDDDDVISRDGKQLRKWVKRI